MYTTGVYIYENTLNKIKVFFRFNYFSINSKIQEFYIFSSLTKQSNVRAKIK